MASKKLYFRAHNDIDKQNGRSRNYEFTHSNAAPLQVFSVLLAGYWRAANGQVGHGRSLTITPDTTVGERFSK